MLDLTIDEKRVLAQWMGWDLKFNGVIWLFWRKLKTEGYFILSLEWHPDSNPTHFKEVLRQAGKVFDREGMARLENVIEESDEIWKADELLWVLDNMDKFIQVVLLVIKDKS